MPVQRTGGESVDVPARQGLTSESAELLRGRFGKNIVESQQGRSWWKTARDVLSEPMFILLLAASLIYFVIGDASEAFLLLGFVLAIVALTAVQSHRTARVLASLREMSAPRAQVLRDGERRLISAADLVPGDLVFVDEGARVPADGVAVEVHGLSVDESLLTGESEAVAKSAIDSEDNRLYFGSMVVQGQAWMTVSTTGAQTELGRIGKSLSNIAEGRSPLQIQMGLFVKRFAMLAILLCAALVVLYRWRYGSWLPGVLAGISLAMGILPEEIPVILTVFMALGARRIAKAGVLTRRMNAIETLGQTTVLCVDKTGTLTQNLMSVRVLSAGGRDQIIDTKTQQIDEHLKELLEYLVLASEIEPVDPMERAFHQTGRQFLQKAERLHTDWTLVHEYELSPALPTMAHAWRAPERQHHAVACKGAPEAVCMLCHLDGFESDAILAEAARMASRGLRVLGVAKANHPGSPWPADQHEFDFSFVGLVGLMDPVRPDAAAAIAECRTAGIRVVMITGDYPSTAQAIASEVGIDATHLLTGQALIAMDDASLQRALRSTSVFARIRPEQKLRLVEAFKARGDVVAMTGDGVNDAPALKSAHIGIAMGNRGAEVAREVASLVLLRDDFAPIVTAIRLGRRIYDNLVQAISYTVAVHLPMVSAVMIPIIFGWRPMLAPVHIVFLELIINPVCSLVFENEPERGGLMRRPPRAAGIALLSSKAMIQCFAIGAVVAFAVLGVYALLVQRGLDPTIARTYGFLSLVFGNVALIFVVRVMSRRHVGAGTGQTNPYLWVVLLATGAALTLLMTVPMFARLFSMAALLAG
ncbi:cation-translocating P-type ATPase [Caballeronia humi]|nr:cation-translocating P-type ATPase [Caballeronia humi]